MKTVGFERCECLGDMDESNANKVKVKLNRYTKLFGWHLKAKTPKGLKYFFLLECYHQYSPNAVS